MLAAVTLTAAVAAAGVALGVLVVVVAAPDVGIVGQAVCQQSLHSVICAAGYAAIQLDAGRLPAACAPPPMPPQISTSAFSACSTPPVRRGRCHWC